jgi:phospholipid/cholesterol/gamma-HCH transport system ATP-binding protein
MAEQRTSNSNAPGSDPPLIETRQLCVSFGAQRVLDGISLAIPRGQTVVVIGESGCGKTVLMKSLIGLVPPTDGSVWFDGRRIDTMGEKELTQQRIRFGFVFQGAALFDSMTVAQNVAFPLRQHTTRSAEEIRQLVIERLAEVGLSESVLEKKPAELSGGMRKRVGLARALAMDPEVLLYDEPTTGLDPIMSDVIAELIVHTRKRNPVTSVVVTHDMRAAEKVADRIVMLYPLARIEPHEHQVLYDGKARDILSSPDRRVVQFVRGEAGERIRELAKG